MRNVLAVLLAVLSLPVAAAGLFPAQPVPMAPGYGASGAGSHFGVPSGAPSRDCVVNPVSLDVQFVSTVVSEFVEGDTISIPSTVLFDFDGDTLRPEGLEKVEEVFTRLVEAGVTELRIVGHTDAKGSDAYNLDLGMRRALAVETALNDLGFETTTADSAGESEPVAPNAFADGRDNPDGRQLNRRVELEVVAVEPVEVKTVEYSQEPRNPQVFHVLSAGNSVFCSSEYPYAGNLLFWGNGLQRNWLFGTGSSVFWIQR